MFIGVYWGARRESRERVADKLSSFLRAIAFVDPVVSSWFFTARRKSEADKPLLTDLVTISQALEVSRKDIGREVMTDLGFSLGVWNGGALSLSVRMGSDNPSIQNSVVISCHDSHPGLSAQAARDVLDRAIAIFQPERGAVTTTTLLNQVSAKHPWEAGWLVYQRGRGIREDRSNVVVS